MVCSGVGIINTVNNELEAEELERYYVGDLFVENHLNFLFNLTLRVYKDVPVGLDTKYNLTDIYYGSNGYYFIKKNSLLMDLRPFWSLCKNKFIL